MSDANALTGIYDYLNQTVAAPMSFDDLLRSKIVYAVSAFDKLIHDLVRMGMVEIYSGRRPATQKYLSEPIPMNIVQQLATASTPPAEIVFEQFIFTKHKILTFQEPEKVADGLSLIWSENQKWTRIAAELGDTENIVRTTLKLIVARRNSIVHEADIDPISHTKIPITRTECDDVAKFISKVGNSIYKLVS